MNRLYRGLRHLRLSLLVVLVKRSTEAGAWQNDVCGSGCEAGGTGTLPRLDSDCVLDMIMGANPFQETTSYSTGLGSLTAETLL